MFVVGALPAFCVLYLMRALDESDQWLSAAAREALGRGRGRRAPDKSGKAALHTDDAVPFAGGAPAHLAQFRDVARLHHRLVGGFDLDARLRRAVGRGAG